MNDRHFDLRVIPRGWQPRTWAERLEVMAAGCEEHIPERAAELRAAATEIHDKLGKPRVCHECGLELETADPGAHPNGGPLICTGCEFRNGHRESWSSERITYYEAGTST